MTLRWLTDELVLSQSAAEQLLEYLKTAFAALSTLPTQDTIVFERFFDEAGGMQLVLHSPYGSRINRAWGLAPSKRFCRKLDFELQAAATEDSIVISLTEAHSFPLEEVARYLHSASARTVLTQALLRLSHVHNALAVGGGGLARPAALSRRQESAAPACSHERGGSARRGFPGSDRVCRESGRRAGNTGPSAE